MSRLRLALRDDQVNFVFAGITILIVAGILAFYFHQRYVSLEQAKQEASRYSLEKSVNAAFAGSEDTSADAPALNRLVRGKLTSIEDKQQRITIATYINFPDTRVTRPITLVLTPRTQFLCWSKTYRSENGASIDVEQAGYLLDENTKLFQRGEKRIDISEAKSILLKHPMDDPTTWETEYGMSALVALEMPFSLNRENRVFQVALLGCDDD
jgi:hypothetical protein